MPPRSPQLRALHLLSPRWLLILLLGGLAMADEPARFSRDVPESISRVTIDSGGDDVESVTSCKGEARRLFVLGERVPKGGRVRRTFLVDTHRPEFPDGRVSLKAREVGSANWDDRLTLEFLGEAARVRATLSMIRPGDAVIIQFGHNDGGPINDDSRARGSIRGTGDETTEIDNLLTKQHEVVRTYVAYLRQYLADARTHTTAAGVDHTARIVVGLLKGLPDSPWGGRVSPAGAEVPVLEPAHVAAEATVPAAAR
jgi:hypothetical protein